MKLEPPDSISVIEVQESRSDRRIRERVAQDEGSLPWTVAREIESQGGMWPLVLAGCFGSVDGVKNAKNAKAYVDKVINEC